MVRVLRPAGERTSPKAAAYYRTTGSHAAGGPDVDLLSFVGELRIPLYWK